MHALEQEPERRRVLARNAHADGVADERKRARSRQGATNGHQFESRCGQVELVAEVPRADGGSVAQPHFVGPDAVVRRAGVSCGDDVVRRTEAVGRGNAVGIDDASPHMIGVARLIVQGVIDWRKCPACGSRSVGCREFGRHQVVRPRPHSNRTNSVRDRSVGVHMLERTKARVGRCPSARPAVHLTRGGVTRGGDTVVPTVTRAVLTEPVRPGGNRLSSEGVDAHAVTPVSRRLPGHHASQVRLDRDVIDHPITALGVMQFEVASVVRDGTRRSAQAERLVG